MEIITFFSFFGHLSTDGHLVCFYIWSAINIHEHFFLVPNNLLMGVQLWGCIPASWGTAEHLQGGGPASSPWGVQFSHLLQDLLTLLDCSRPAVRGVALTAEIWLSFWMTHHLAHWSFFSREMSSQTFCPIFKIYSYLYVFMSPYMYMDLHRDQKRVSDSLSWSCRWLVGSCLMWVLGAELESSRKPSFSRLSCPPLHT